MDIGGTFTDAVILDEENREVLLSKVPSTPQDYSEGVFESISHLVRDMAQIENFIHGTTVGTNAIIQGIFDNAGLLTTQGFKDILEIGRGNRVDMYDPFYRMPEPLIPRDRRLEIEERMGADGTEIKPINFASVEEKIRELVDSRIKTVAICFINAYANSEHEEKVRSLLNSRYPQILVSASTEITREYNEYERTSTVVLNTLLLSIMRDYLGKVEKEIAARKFPGMLMLIQSNGGLMTSTYAKKVPVHTINSGLVGGILAVQTLGEILEIPNLIGADMGGTSFDVELVINGKYETTPILRIRTPRSGPDGYPILIPAVDIHAIGTGGGSIAWADSTGALHVGPMSASADPGPACYGKGGDKPTVTDANLVLGRLIPDRFLGGDMKVYPELSRKALKTLADQFSMDILEVAEGILRIAVPNMAAAIRTMTIERGIDPREFTMVSFGGAGPLHANLIAKELDIPTTIVSTMPGNFSAWGMLMADFRRDYVQTFVRSMMSLGMSDLEDQFSKLESDAFRVLSEEGVPRNQTILVRELDVRYIGQGHALTLSLPDHALSEVDKMQIERKFDDLHLKRYMHNAPSQSKEVVALRLASIGRMKKGTLSKIKSGGSEPPRDALLPEREVYLDGSYMKSKIYERSKLLANNVLRGPAVVEERVSTTLLLEGYKARVDSFGHLIISAE